MMLSSFFAAISAALMPDPSLPHRADECFAAERPLEAITAWELGLCSIACRNRHHQRRCHDISNPTQQLADAQTTSCIGGADYTR